MKTKILSIILVVVMMLSISSPALAVVEPSGTSENAADLIKKIYYNLDAQGKTDVLNAKINAINSKTSPFDWDDVLGDLETDRVKNILGKDKLPNGEYRYRNVLKNMIADAAAIDYDPLNLTANIETYKDNYKNYISLLLPGISYDYVWDFYVDVVAIVPSVLNTNDMLTIMQGALSGGYSSTRDTVTGIGQKAISKVLDDNPKYSGLKTKLAALGWNSTILINAREAFAGQVDPNCSAEIALLKAYARMNVKHNSSGNTSLVVGGGNITYGLDILGYTFAGSLLYWKSSNDSVIKKVNSQLKMGDSVFVPVAAGTAEIIAYAGEAQDASERNWVVKIPVTVSQPPPPPPVINVTGVSLNKTNTTIEVGSTDTLVATVSPSNATNKSVVWSSSNNSVATVTNGVVTGVSAGAATITVTTVDGGKTATCAITVTGKKVTGVKLNKTVLSLEVGSSETLQATVEPADAGNKSVTWSSSDPSKASVDRTGKVTGVAPGTATITVTTVDGGKTATCLVTVGEIRVTGVKLSTHSITVAAGSGKALQATVEPANATVKDVTWSSSDTGIATVDENGMVAGVSPGEADITVKTVDGNFTDTCRVTVEGIKVTGVTLNKDKLKIKAGTSETLTATVMPANASNKRVTWSSSDTNIAQVDENGTVFGLSPGSAVITVTTEDGNFTGSCQVDVTGIPVEAVKLNKHSLKLALGDKDRLKAAVEPGKATNKNVMWSSSDPAVALVDEEGNISGESGGTAIITVTTKDGGFTDSCVVTVISIPVKGVSLSSNSLTIKAGKNIKLRADVTPKNASNKNVIWSSDDTLIAQVDSEGTVSAISPGSTVITVTTVDGGYTDECMVIVSGIPVEGVKLNRTTLSLKAGSDSRLKASLEPSKATNKNLFWSSSDPAIAEVDDKGNVTGVSPGAATITVTTEDGGFTDSCEVMVTGVPVEGVELNKHDLELKPKDKARLTVSISPKNATNKNVTWESSDPGVVKVDGRGMVTAVSTGTATITVTTEDGKFTDTCIVVVQGAPVTGVKMAKFRSVRVGRSVTLKATVSPNDASNKNVSWESSDPEIVSVDSNGLITGLSPGTAYITVTTEDGGFTASCKVTVRR